MKYALILFCLMMLVAGCGKTPPLAGNAVAYIDFTPELDGRLDEKLAHLPIREFGYFSQFDNPPTDTVPVTYRLAYNETYFYLYIETGADSITHRKRGFSAGDGARLLVGRPKDSLTDEFYELVFSPSEDKTAWGRKKIWTYNVETVLKDLSEASEFATHEAKGKTGFEFLISWQDIPPYHPWFSDDIGLNVYFAKAIGDTITNGYAMYHDEGIWGEGVKRRAVRQDFARPAHTDRLLVLSRLEHSHCRVGETVQLTVAGISPSPVEHRETVQLKDSAGREVYRNTIQAGSGPAFARQQLTLDVSGLLEGVYSVETRREGQPAVVKAPLTVFRPLDYEGARQTILDNADTGLAGATNTLLFTLGDLRQRLAALKPYESGGELYREYRIFTERLARYEAGTDPYRVLRKNYRRAFLSAIDSTYQPYSITLPVDYTPRKKYPLLVFLHGSGVTEEHVLDQDWSDGSCIVIAPLGRDLYGAYHSKAAQTDIMEAVRDVMKHFSVDASKVLVGGFSMGGYGALRTFYEKPGFFKGVAVFSGHPDLINQWLDETSNPNFLLDKYLKGFNGVPVFIFHGVKDGIPYKLMEKTAQKLRQHEAEVVLELDEEKGHEYPDPETMQKYFGWLKECID